MRIDAVSFQPYVYHVNAISPASMNRLSKISDDVLDQKTDFSGLVENENPLQKGQTLNFADMLQMQMQRGRSAAARVMKPAEEAQEQTNAAVQERENAADTVQFEKETVENAQTAAFESGSQDGISNYRMQQAISAYEMFMTA